ncbi:MAG: hypothetical protein P9L99_19865 [Candidatus Lernaella stagnicola]|nr:hypothetical protein [Candidatus Lernaella stagnicola]
MQIVRKIFGAVLYKRDYCDITTSSSQKPQRLRAFLCDEVKSMSRIRSELEKELGIVPQASFGEIGRKLGMSYQQVQFIYYRAWFKILKELTGQGKDVEHLRTLIPAYYVKRFGGRNGRTKTEVTRVGNEQKPKREKPPNYEATIGKSTGTS